MQAAGSAWIVIVHQMGRDLWLHRATCATKRVGAGRKCGSDTLSRGEYL